MDLKDIVTEEFQQEIQESFAYATGFGVVFIDKKEIISVREAILPIFVNR